MKPLSKLIPLILAALLLSACAGNVDAAPNEDASLSEVYTAVAMTLAAQASLVTPTRTTLPSASPTIWASPTFIASTPTTQSESPYTSASYSTAYGCYNAAYVSDVTIADGTVLAPGEAFIKTWKLQNTGSCDWNEDFWITFSSGEDMDGNDTEIDEAVDAGDKADVSVSLMAPDDEGTYTGYWQLSTEDGADFGERVYVLIIVSDDAATSTPTPTATATVAAATSTVTLTPAPNSTPTLTGIPTDLPTSTPAEDSEATETAEPGS